jgi:broad specificity phosphatase PhoE
MICVKSRLHADISHDSNISENQQLTARLTLISHAATSAQRRAAFPLDEPIEEREIAKIAALGWTAPRARRIVAAPELRTQQTAQALGLCSTVEADLRECDYGTWRGREIVDLQKDEQGDITAWLTDPAAAPHGGESLVNLVDRVARWLDEQSNGDHGIAVTHPAIIRCAVIHTLQAPIQAFWRVDIAPLSVTDIRVNGRVWTLRSSACALSKYKWDDTQDRES